MPTIISRLLNQTWFLIVTRLALTFVFWSSGLMKLFNFSQAVAEMQFFHLPYPTATAVAVILIQLIGPLLIVLNRHAWLGAGALSVFTALTIPLVHRFWALPEPQATDALHFATEHVTVIGALAAATLLASPGREGAREVRADSPMTAVESLPGPG